jgi:hypothetical protein
MNAEKADKKFYREVAKDAKVYEKSQNEKKRNEDGLGRR